MEVDELEESKRHPELQFFDLNTLIAATDNFSDVNKLGEGGFGCVYKVSPNLDVLLFCSFLGSDGFLYYPAMAIKGIHAP